MHYALLAEMYDIELFCAGVEFQQATLTHPEAWKPYSGRSEACTGDI